MRRRLQESRLGEFPWTVVIPDHEGHTPPKREPEGKGVGARVNAWSCGVGKASHGLLSIGTVHVHEIVAFGYYLSDNARRKALGGGPINAAREDAIQVETVVRTDLREARAVPGEVRGAHEQDGTCVEDTRKLAGQLL